MTQSEAPLPPCLPPPPHRPVSLHSPLLPAAGIWGEEPRRVHDGDAAGAADEEGLDAHGPEALGALRRR